MNGSIQRDQTFQARKMLIRHCIDEFQRLDRGTDESGGANRSAPAPIIALRNGVESLAQVGSEIEGHFVRALADRLFRCTSPCENTPLRRCVEGAIMRLSVIPWLPNALLTREARLRQAPFRLFFIRHAESTGNQQRRLLGSRIHGALTQRGLAQSRRTAGYLFEAFDELRSGKVLLASSPIGRALDTARSISERLGCPLSTYEDLAELDFGEWSGRVYADLDTDAFYQAWSKDKWLRLPPGGESLFEVRTRMCQAVSSLISQAALNETPLVVVTHFFPLIAVLDALMPGHCVRPDNSSVTCLEFTSGQWRPIAVNHTAHLGGDAPTPVAYV